MKIWIALLRGVNVGGRNKLPMKMLADELETIGLSDIKTYLQSGNVVFRCLDKRATSLAAEIAAAIKSRFSFELCVVVIDGEELAAAARCNPFPESETETETEMDGKALHLFFLAKAPAKIDQVRLDAVRRPSERWQLKGSVFYLHTPEGFGNSKLAAQTEKILGVPATARNWRTVSALLDLAGK